MELHVKLNLRRPSTKLLVITVLTLIVAAAVWGLFLRSGHSTIPQAYRQQAGFKTVSAPQNLVKADTYNYVSQNQTLAFTINFQGRDFAVTEQKAPNNLTSGTGVYFQSLGLHPVAQFQSSTGPVAILNFYKSGSLANAGQSGLLVTGQTMVIVTATDPSQKPTNDQWKQLFDALKLDK